MKTFEQYAERLAPFSRADLLKLCRAAGLKASGFKTNKELIEVLYKYVGCKA